MRYQRSTLLCCLIGCLLGSVAVTAAQTVSASRSLQGLDGAMVRVEAADQLKKDGLIIGQVVSDVKAILNDAGITVLTPNEWRQRPGRPYLMIQVNSTKIQDNWKFYTYSIRIHLIQDVYLARLEQSEPVSAATWFKAVSGHGYLGDIRIKIKEVMDQFIEDYSSGQKP